MTREGVCDWYLSNRHDFAYNRRCFLGTLKVILSCINRKNPVSALCVKKGGDFFLNKELVSQAILEIPYIVDSEESISDNEYLLELNPKSKWLHQLCNVPYAELMDIKNRKSQLIRTSL